MKKILFISLLFLSGCVVVAQTTPTIKQVLKAGNNANEQKITNVAIGTSTNDVVVKIQLDSVRNNTNVSPLAIPYENSAGNKFINSPLGVANNAVFNNSAYNGLIKSTASAPTLTLTTSDSYTITGTTTIGGIAKENGNTSNSIGAIRHLIFAGVLQLTNSTHLILPNGLNITTKVGDVADFIELDTTGYAANGYTKWQCINYSPPLNVLGLDSVHYGKDSVIITNAYIKSAYTQIFIQGVDLTRQDGLAALAPHFIVTKVSDGSFVIYEAHTTKRRRFYWYAVNKN